MPPHIIVLPAEFQPRRGRLVSTETRYMRGAYYSAKAYAHIEENSLLGVLKTHRESAGVALDHEVRWDGYPTVERDQAQSRQFNVLSEVRECNTNRSRSATKRLPIYNFETEEFYLHLVKVCQEKR